MSFFKTWGYPNYLFWLSTVQKGKETTVEAPTTHTLVSEQLYLRSPHQNFVFLNSHTWTLYFYIPVSGQFQLRAPFTRPEGVRLRIALVWTFWPWFVVFLLISIWPCQAAWGTINTGEVKPWKGCLHSNNSCFFMCIAKINKGFVLLKRIEKSWNLCYVIKLSDPFFAATE